MLRKRPGRYQALLRRLGRAQLRTRVLAGVLLIMLAALVAFDFAAVTALRDYLLGHTDEQLQEVIGLYKVADAPLVVTPWDSAFPLVTGVPALSKGDYYAGRVEIAIAPDASRQPVAAGHAQVSAPRAAYAGVVITGPRVQLSASALDQFYVAYRSRATQVRLVHGNPDLIPSVA